MEEFGGAAPSGRRLRAFGLHNIDVVDLPREADGSSDLSAWFGFDLRVPSEGFGASPFRVSARCESTTPVEDVRMTFSFESQDAPSDAGARFRLEWHLEGPAGGTDQPAGPETVRPRLDAAHAYLGTAFRAAFTDAMWARFSPADEPDARRRTRRRMILAPPPVLADLPPAAPAVEMRDVTQSDRTGATTLRHRVFYGPLRVGKRVCPLRKAIRGELLPAPAMPAYSLRPDQTEVRVPELPGDDFLGRGATAAEAWENWFDRFHTQFQRLYRTPGFERTAEQEVNWQRLCRIVDVTEYQQTQPLEAREIGLLASNEPGRRKVEWVGRGAPESISSHVSLDLPGEFAAMKSGQWFEMTTVRHPADGRLLGGSGVTPLRKSPLKATAAEWEDFEAAWGSTATLPATSWD